MLDLPGTQQQYNDSTTRGDAQPQAWAASSRSPSTPLLSQARSEGTAALLLSATMADSISLRGADYNKQPLALPAWLSSMQPLKVQPLTPASPGQAGEGDVLKWLFTVDSLVPMQSSGRSRLTCLLIFKRRRGGSWKGGKKEEMGQKMHNLFVFRQSKSTLYSLLLRAQTGWEKENGLPPDLSISGRRREGNRQSTNWPSGRRYFLAPHGLQALCSALRPVKQLSLTKAHIGLQASPQLEDLGFRGG